ncbi:hypothetical protein [Enterobacter sp. Bisph1]|uniref:hypothetical protein n=1 Tax=Enterobacter sp. Bisph1 TaxID=1274399 RepID=UPI00057BE38D|nr:hypothetical protein [Enterobacter sp. Bisph1]
MRKLSAIVLASFAIAVTLAWPYIKMEFASSAWYTEQDKRQYNYYTPDLFKKIPRISKDYSFSFGRVTGTEANVFTLRFYGVTDTEVIRRFLISEGYQPQTSCDVDAECWNHAASHDDVSIGNLRSEKAVFVQIYRRLYDD